MSRRFEGRPSLAPIVLAALVYNSVFSLAGFISDAEYPLSDLLLYFGGGAILLTCLCIVVSMMLDCRLRACGRVPWTYVLLLSLLFTVLDLPAFWLMLSPAARARFEFLGFLSGALTSGVTGFAVWSILHLCIRSAERAIALERRTVVLREAVLRYENEALSCALDSGFFLDALTRIERALNEKAGVLASEIVMSLAERMRAALAPREARLDEAGDAPFAGGLGSDEGGEMAVASLRRLLLIGALGVWTAFLGEFFLMEVFTGRAWWKSLSDYGGQAVVGALWFVGGGRILRKATTGRVQALYLLVFGICVLGVCACAAAMLGAFAVRGELAWPPLTRWILGFQLNYVTPLFIGWAAVYLLIDARMREIVRLKAAAEIREAALNARNAVLRLQLNPHFLFNILNALYVLVLDRQFERAQGAIAAVRLFLDHAAGSEAGELVALSRELATQDAYLEIERVRFGERLQVARRIEAEVAGAKVPHLILQPLVENAVKYAVARTDRPVAVEIRARRAGGELVLEVADTGAPEAAPRPPGLGVGLRNVEARLKSLYGDAGRLACRSLDPAGFLAEVRLPLSL